MPWNDEGDCRDKGYHQQLPIPYVSLEEETGKRQGGADKTTYRLWTKAQDETCHETAYADKQSLEGAVEYFKDSSKAHGCPSDTTDEAHEYPHLQNDVRFEGTLVRALIVLVQEVDHQGGTHQRDTHPYPFAPVLVPQHQCKELHEQEEGSRIAPSQKKVLARRFFTAYHLTPYPSDNV